MKCISCAKSIQKVNLFRTGEIGQSPDWMCEKCILKLHDKSLIPTEIKKITDILKNESQANTK